MISYGLLSQQSILLIDRVSEKLISRNMLLGTAESCTGGLVAALCTEVSGSSAWFAGGIVSYANSVKEHVLGVPANVLAAHGAVSEPVVCAMAAGVLSVLGVQASVALSGVAGPTGGSVEKPVGTVWIAAAVEQGGKTTRQAEQFLFQGTRGDIRLAAVLAAFAFIEKNIE